MTLPLNGRVALVTGANHGIGAATASALAFMPSMRRAGSPGRTSITEKMISDATMSVTAPTITRLST